MRRGRVHMTVSFRQPCKKHCADAGLWCSAASVAGISAIFGQIRARTGGGPARWWAVARCSDRSG